MKELNNIKYGYVDKDGNIHIRVDDHFSNDYRLQSPEEVLNSRVGVCWDQVELERYLFDKKGISFNTYYIAHYDNDKCPTHTFLIYKENKKYYWYEHSWELFRGIHEFKSELEAIKDITDKFIKNEIKGEFEPKNLCIYKYNKPKYGITPLEFSKHCEKGENITWEQ